MKLLNGKSSKLAVTLAVLLTFVLLATPASGQFAETKLQDSGVVFAGFFGWSVAISGDRAIVGAPLANSGEGGAAYVFERDGGGNWTEAAKLRASDKQPGDEFGWSVSISGDRAIVGAIRQDASGSRTGAAYVFERDGGGNWSEVTKLQASDKQRFDEFGFSVSISGDRAIVGARLKNNGTGAAYVFERDGGGNWIEVAKLLASDGQAIDVFGESVSISGDWAIVGARLEDTGGTNAGAAYIFERDGGGNWSQVTKLQASDKQESDEFGISVSISGGQAIVGAPLEDTGETDAGAAYVFERDVGGIWNEVVKLQASDKLGTDEFGNSVAISGDRAIVGAHRAGGRPRIGAAYVFERNGGGNWSEIDKLLASDPQSSDQFGTSVAISGDRAIVGAPFKNTLNQKAGAAYVYELVLPNQPPVATAAFDPINVEEDEGFFQIVATATDPDDNLATVVAVIETPSIAGLEIELEVDERVKVEFDLEEATLEIKGPDPQAVLDQIQQLGGILVVNGQITRIEIDDDAEGAEFKFEEDGTLNIEVDEVILRVTASDTEGETNSATASPVFSPDGGDEGDD